MRGGSFIGETPVEADTPTGVSIWCFPGRHRNAEHKNQTRG